MYFLLAPRFSRPALAVAAAVLLLAAARPARAGIVVSVQDVTAQAGSTGNTLEVDVSNTGSLSVDISAFSFEISVASGSGVTFTGASDNTSLQTYVFSGNSLFGPIITKPGTTPGTTLDASDIATTGSTSLAGGETLGLGLGSFDVTGSTPTGPVTVTLTGYPSTSLTASNTSNIPIDTLNNGTITITPSAVPEPSSLVSAALGLLGAGWLVRRRRASAGPDLP